MTETNPCKKKSWLKMNFRSLKLSLKFRPELLKLILKMRQCILKRNTILKSLKHRLKQLEANANDKSTEQPTTTNPLALIVSANTETKKLQDSSTQTKSDNDKDQLTKNELLKVEIPKLDPPLNITNEIAGWNVAENGNTEKSIAEQVKEAAQSALQDTGMVYVESAGMYYDYKTGYYYNSELGLYYHTDTGCYYYYSDDKQFVFHSYPDMSKVNVSLIAHQNKKARKLKRERKPEDDIDNLTKHLSQDKEDGGNPKKARKTKKEKVDKKSKIEDKKKKKHEKIYDTEEKNDKIEAKDSKDDTNLENKSDDDKKANQDNHTLCDDNNDTDMFEIKDENKDTEKKENKDSDESVDTEKSNKNKIKNKVDEEINEPSLVDDKDQIESELNQDKKENLEELEDGECSGTESEDSESGSESDVSTSTVSDEDSVAKHHPPCMRIIVRETKLPKLKVGSLFLITKDGGTVGREGDHHAILLRDHNVSRNHLNIKYDMSRKIYQATDLGSKNGTILNGVRISDSQETSLPLDILHGSVIQLGETKLLCHIHPGHATCGQCEPGLLMQVEEEKKVAYTRTVSVKKQHELELARLKNSYVPQRLAIEEKPYNDRAQARRDAVGSTNHAEKTQATDLDTSIASDNKGFKLLQKMGWSEGEGLGKDNQGETEPVPLLSNEGKAGLGTVGGVALPSNVPKPRIIKNNLASGAMRLAARTNMLRPPAKAFQNDDEDEFE